MFWNARGLLSAEHGRRDQKLAYLRQLRRSMAWVAVTETHGNDAEMRAFVSELGTPVVRYGSFCESRDTGGVCFASMRMVSILQAEHHKVFFSL